MLKYDLIDKVQKQAKEFFSYPSGNETELLKKYLFIGQQQVRYLTKKNLLSPNFDSLYSLKLEQIIKRLFANALRYVTPTDKSISNIPVVIASIGTLGYRDSFVYSKLKCIVIFEDKFEQPDALKLSIQKQIGDQLSQWGIEIYCLCSSLEQFSQQLQTSPFLHSECLSIRYVAGSHTLFKKVKKLLFDELTELNSFLNLLNIIEKVRLTRRSNYKGTYCLGEPHIRDGVGGLKDYHEILSLLPYAQHFLSLDLHTNDLLNLHKAYKTLLKIRNALYLVSGREENCLFYERQEPVAQLLKLTARDRKSSLLKSIYQCAKAAESYFLQLKSASLWKCSEGKTLRVVDGFQVKSQCLHCENPEIFNTKPLRVMRIFRYAQAFNKNYSLPLSRLITNAANALKGSSFLDNKEVLWTFKSIFSHNGNIYPILKSMYYHGLLAKLLPVVVHYFQQMGTFIHQTPYTLGVHGLHCIEYLDALFKQQNASSPIQEVLREISEPIILYFSFLFNAIDKEDIFLHLIQQLKLSDYQQSMLCMLREHRDLLLNFAEHQDISDAHVMEKLVDTIKTYEGLQYLYVYTICDVSVKCGQAPSKYKLLLLNKIYKNATRIFKGQSSGLLDMRRRLIQHFSDLSPLDEEWRSWVGSFFNCVDANYIYQHNEQQIEEHLLWARQTNALNIRWHVHSKQENCWVLCIVERSSSFMLHLLKTLLTCNFSISRFHLTQLPHDKCIIEAQCHYLIASLKQYKEDYRACRKQLMEWKEVQPELKNRWALAKKWKQAFVELSPFKLCFSEVDRTIELKFKCQENPSMLYQLSLCLLQHACIPVRASVRFENPVGLDFMSWAPTDPHHIPDLIALHHDLSALCA